MQFCALFPPFLVTSSFLLANTVSAQTNSAPPCQCAGEETFEATMHSGVFKSPGFPYNYCNNLNCRWAIAPPGDENSFVGAMLDFFETEQKHDVLEVYQTAWNGSTLLSAKQAILSGDYDPRTMERHFFSSLGGGLLFRFVTDSSESDFHGFQVSFRRYPKEDRSAAPCPPPFHVAIPQAQSLPVLASNFRTDSSCIFVINSSEAVKLSVDRFASASLSLVVHETENFQARQSQQRPLAKIRYMLPPVFPFSVTSRSQSLSVLVSTQRTFATDPDSIARPQLAVQGVPLGDLSTSLYGIRFEQARGLCQCFPGQVVLSRLHPSSLTSPGFPLEYCDNANCTATVALEGPYSSTGDQLDVIRMRVEQFRTEPDVDFVALRLEQGLPLIGLSSLAKGIRYFTFDSARFSANFFTDHSITDVGFNFTLEAIKKRRDCLCPGAPRLLSEGRAYHEDFQFSTDDCPFMDCFWAITRPKSGGDFHRIVLRLNHSLVDTKAFVEVYQGENRDRNPFVYRLEGDSAGEGRLFEFVGEEKVGLWLHREPGLYNGDRQTIGLSFSYEWREVCNCGAERFQADPAQWRPLRSPDYPNTYCRLMRCRWLLEAPEGHHLALNVSAFDTEADQDFLYVFDGNDTTGKHKESMSGVYSGQNPVHGTQRAMALLFLTDSSIQLRGFEIWFKAEPNPEEAVSGSRRFPKVLVFFLLLTLAATAAVFLFVRSNRQIAWPNFNPIEEGRVRFERWTHHHRRQPSDQSPVLTSSPVDNVLAPNVSPFSSTNPLFAFGRPQNVL